MRADSQWKRSKDPPNGSVRLMRASNRGWRRGFLPTQHCAPPACIKGVEGFIPTRQRATKARIQGTEEEGTTPEKQHALPVHDLRERGKEGGEPL